MTLYVYDPDTMIVAARVHGDNNAACEAAADEGGYGDTEAYLRTYSPAFGANDGLIDSKDAEDIDA